MRFTYGFALAFMLSMTGVVARSQGPMEPAAQHEARTLAGELMSPYCPGLLLSTCRSAGAVALRGEIAARLERGETRAAIVEDLAARFGESIRSVPEPRGMGLVVWLAPGVIVAGTFAVLLQSLRRATSWRLAMESDPAVEGVVDDPDTVARLDDELRDLD